MKKQDILKGLAGIFLSFSLAYMSMVHCPGLSSKILNGFKKEIGTTKIEKKEHEKEIPKYNIPMKTKAEKIYKWMCEKPKDSYETFVLYHGIPVGVKRVMVKEEDISKHNYKWEWNLHRIHILIDDYKDIETPKKDLDFMVRKYQELTTAHSQQYIEYILKDYKADGILEEKTRYFEILQNDWDGEDNYFYLIPEYPKGFVNENWKNLSDEKKAKEIYNKELDFWYHQVLNDKNLKITKNIK